MITPLLKPSKPSLEILRKDLPWCKKWLYVWYWPSYTGNCLVDYIWVITVNADGSTDVYTIHNNICDSIHLKLPDLKLTWESTNWYNHIEENPWDPKRNP